MTTPNLQVRRATVDDLRPLEGLWRQEQLPWKELEPKFKEFQLVQAEDGQILGAIGVHIEGTEGRLHSEAFAHPEQADQLRGMLWDRVQIQAKNHGLVRVWTQLATPFWHSLGLNTADDNALAKLPVGFRGASTQPWLYAQLRDELPPIVSADKEFALFREAERERTERIMRQAKALKMLAAVISMGVLILVVVWAYFYFQIRSQTGQ